MRNYQHFYVDGEWVDPIESRPFDLINPATEERFATVSLGGVADVDRAVAAARKAFRTFSRMPRAERSELLRSIISVYEQRQPEIMAALTEEMGAPASMKAHTQTGLAAFRQSAKVLETYEFETRIDGNLVVREPIGVAGLITPWNWPNQLICNKLASAFAAGCTTVLKPSEFTPIDALILADILHEAGTPNGAYNVVNGDGPTVGAAISRHEEIALVSFTGSTRAGILVAEAAASSVKRVAQELGGKSANIVLPDADVKIAAEFQVSRGFSNAGQSCHSPTRLLIHKSQQEEMLSLLIEATAKVKVGDPTDQATNVGPVVNKTQFDRIQNYIAIGEREGGRIVCGGLGRPEGLTKGYYVRPTIFAGVTPEMRIAREEIFGPVISVMTYDRVEDAIEVANDSSYGLGAYVFSRDSAKALDVALQFQAGRVFVNGAPSNTAAPMGGYKKSGNGREMGVFGLEEYLETKAIIGA
jgi:aldehyde dehydrogenase (NAD+)